MLKRTQVLFTVVVLLFTANLGLGERVYEYEVTVGNGPGYDHDTINAAIVDVNENRSSDDALACIWVYPGEYEEQLRDPYKYTAPPPPDGDGQEHWFNLGCNSLPVNCDLRKPESELEEVKIIHSSPPTQYGIDYWWHISKYGVDCKGNNVLEGLTVENWFGSQHPGHYVQASVGFNGYGELRNCVISNGHAPGVQGLTTEEMIVSGCTISTYFGACIDALGTFTISDCELHPRAMSYLIELPTGILAYGSGTIERVTITANCTSSYHAAGAGLFGIRLALPQNKEVTISDVKINLQLTSKYNQSETAALRVCGILSGSMWYGPSNQYPGYAVVRDCTIDVKGIEGTYPEGCGADIMVDGVCTRRRDGRSVGLFEDKNKSNPCGRTNGGIRIPA
jgi:hypothetical protein